MHSDRGAINQDVGVDAIAFLPVDGTAMEAVCQGLGSLSRAAGDHDVDAATLQAKSDGHGAPPEPRTKAVSLLKRAGRSPVGGQGLLQRTHRRRFVSVVADQLARP